MKLKKLRDDSKVTCKDKRVDDSKPICKEKWEDDKTQATGEHIGKTIEKNPYPSPQKN